MSQYLAPAVPAPAPNPDAATDALLLDVPRGDPLRVVAHLFSSSRHQYAALMDILDDTADDLTLAQITEGLRARGLDVAEPTVAVWLDRLHRRFEAVRSDPANDFGRLEDMRATRWRYHLTTTGRKVHQFWRRLGEENAGAREIPLTSLRAMVDALGRLVQERLPSQEAAQQVEALFLARDALDQAMEANADHLADLANRFNLDRDEAIELKRLLVTYATHVAAQVHEALFQAFDLLTDLQPRFAELAALTASQSRAAELVSRGHLAAAHGSREEHWVQLLEWCRPVEGRAARFTRGLVLAIRPLHLNLRRLQKSGPTSLRSKALQLARACDDREWGPRVSAAALGDHGWLKLTGWSEDGEGASWHDGPVVGIGSLERTAARSGGGSGSVARARNRSECQSLLEEAEREQARARAAAIAEVLGGRGPLSPQAGRVALEAVAAALSGPGSDGMRTGADRSRWLMCTVSASAAVGRVTGQDWSALLPGHQVLFHPRTSAASGSPVPGNAE